MNRSYLFVPADSERKFVKALVSGADALILDLEDAVADAAKESARQALPERLGTAAEPELWVRVNPVNSQHNRRDIDALQQQPPAGVVLPKCRGADDLRTLEARLATMERRAGVSVGSTRVLPLVTECAEALFRVSEYAQVRERLAGLTWGAEDLAADVGAEANKDADGNWLPTFELARSLCLLGAAAAGIPAIDTVYVDVRNAEGMEAFANRARRDGFAGMLAIHPAQLAAIHKAFTPSADALARARRIIALFVDNPGVGVLELDGRMLDRPHYVQAQRLLAVARRTGSS